MYIYTENILFSMCIRSSLMRITWSSYQHAGSKLRADPVVVMQVCMCVVLHVCMYVGMQVCMSLAMSITTTITTLRLCAATAMRCSLHRKN